MTVAEPLCRGLDRWRQSRFSQEATWRARLRVTSLQVPLRDNERFRRHVANSQYQYLLSLHLAARGRTRQGREINKCPRQSRYFPWHREIRSTADDVTSGSNDFRPFAVIYAERVSNYCHRQYLRGKKQSLPSGSSKLLYLEKRRLILIALYN